MKSVSDTKQQTLFSFFKKKEGTSSPATPVGTTPVRSTPTNVKQNTPLASPLLSSAKRVKASAPENTMADESIEVNASDQEEEVVKSKRRRVVLVSSDEEEGAEGNTENHDQSANVTPKPKKTVAKRAVEKSTPASAVSVASSRGRNSAASTPVTPAGSIASRARSNLQVFQSPSVADDLPSDDVAPARSVDDFPHLKDSKFSFLWPEKIMDIAKRRPDKPEYDASTLYVPADFLKKQTPGLQQWWQFKSQNYDTLLAHKVGKFYELYHMDAVIAVEVLGLAFMGGEIAHCGFPEGAFPTFADKLLARGLKIARIEQTETPSQMSERRQSSSGTGAKVVEREICQILTPGTRAMDVHGGSIADRSSGCLMAVSEAESTVVSGGKKDSTSFGVAFVDTTTGLFTVAQFDDDRQRSNIRTLLSQHHPAHLLYQKRHVSEETERIFSTMGASALKESVTSPAFWNSAKLLQNLVKDEYFKSKDEDASPESNWPPVIREMLLDPATGAARPSPDCELCLSALACLVNYLKKCLIERPLLSLGQFERYIPPDSSADSQAVGPQVKTTCQASRLLLDSITLRNLDIIENSSTGTQAGTLLQLLDTCSTEFGKRQLRSWLCAPPARVDEIQDRQRAIDEMERIGKLDSLKKDLLKKIPDLERLLNKIHGLGHPLANSHPNRRAVMFNELQYRKSQISELGRAIAGFETAVLLFKKLEGLMEGEFSSKILADSVSGVPVAEISSFLADFKSRVDIEEMKKKGEVTIKPGMSEDYDKCSAEVDRISEELDDLLQRYVTENFKGRKISYWGTGRNRFQIEIPDSVNVPDSFNLSSQKKGFRRYRTASVDKLFEKLTSAEERREVATRDSLRLVFSKFSSNFAAFDRAVRAVANIDCLMALSTYSRSLSFLSCTPEFVATDEPFIEIEDGCHPCILPMLGNALIPNDTTLSAVTAPVLLLTGPNMGGKSTLMRQVGLLAILAHLGCRVPAKSMRLSPIDRIFTRIGASDRIISGESTFYVEMAETSLILRRATTHSLCLIDELGRGTSTYDGLAVAGSVLQNLALKKRCRTVFSTHYHLLVSAVAQNPVWSERVKLGHMGCKVEKDSNDDGSGVTLDSVTFLYRLTDGACPKSYGFNAAALAGLPVELIRAAAIEAAKFEKCETLARRIRNILSAKSAADLECLDKQSTA